MKIIATGSPFAAGGEFDRAWKEARRLDADIVDEHYYQSPQWYRANMERYHHYPTEGPKVFLGEYASWGNTFENALVEAAYMVEMQNAPTVSLACYAPMLCHVDYVNWKPDLIWFDNYRVLKTANYYVQKLFMNHQGDTLLAIDRNDVLQVKENEKENDPPVSGGISLSVNDITARFTNILVTYNGETQHFADCVLEKQQRVDLQEIQEENYTLECCVERLSGWKGARIHFGRKDDENQLNWNVGGWENQDTIIESRVGGRGSCLTQSEFSMKDNHCYRLKLEVKGRNIRTYIDDQLANITEDRLPGIGRLHLSASREERGGDVILKGVNLKETSSTVEISLADFVGSKKISIYTMKDIPLESENTFENSSIAIPEREERYHEKNAFEYVFAPNSVTIIRFHKS
ncbi:MAG: hypothetical protein GX786_10875 [Clostridiales bacterium]|nr:hypothetical protein [Clostridiales bacterium]